MKTTHTILDEIMVDVRREIAGAQTRRSIAELRRMAIDAPPVRSFANALSGRFGLIAEIKERSPSQGAMRPENVADAPAAYEACHLVHAISVLTNASHFGMGIERLRKVKIDGSKPVLRKDFIVDEYQVHEARAFGADAILLMANLLDPAEMARLFSVACELGMDVLFECHDETQIRQLPAGVVLCGINSRTFSVRGQDYAAARASRAAGKRDLTTDLGRFELGRLLPPGTTKVAESGVHPENAARIRDELNFQAILVGTSLLTSPAGIHAELERFEKALM